MSNELLGIVMLGSLLIVIFIGFPISFTLISVAIVFGYIGLGNTVFDLMVYQTYGLMQEEVFAAVPLFIFMGYIVQEGALVERLFNGFRHLLAPLKGSLYLGVILTAVIFAMATGIVGASVTVLGIISIPIMMKSGYDVRLTSGAIAAGGTLGILIPPSVMLIVMGPVLGVSVARLYAAAFVPGFLLAVIYIGYVLIRSYLNPRLGPPMPIEERITSKIELMKEFFIGIVPLGILITATLGSILAGIATPTEAASVGCLGAMVLSLFYRGLNWAKLKKSAITTLQTTSMILFLALASNIFGSTFARLGSAKMITNAIIGLQFPPFVMLLLLMLLIFLLGWPFEWPTIILVYLPILLPVVRALEIDLVWFGVLTAVALQTSYLSPPVAMSAYYLKAIAPQWELSTIYKGMAEFMVLQVIALIIMLLFPQIILWLPKVLIG